LAGNLTDPLPRAHPLSWEPFVPASSGVELLPRPTLNDDRSFYGVLTSRHSSLGGPVSWSQIGELLWHAAAYKGFAAMGRAGLPIAWSASPTSGGLQSINIVCVLDDGSPAKLYEPSEHAFRVLVADRDAIGALNSEAVGAVLGAYRGCTLRLIADWAKLSAAYENADSLPYRDAGCITSILCLCAEWLNLCACPLGFLGEDILPLIGMPSDRFRAVGGVQISKKSC
jgi:hypothetical protein